MSQTNTRFDDLKDWFTFIVAVVACVSGIIFWVQSADNPRFEKIEQDIGELRQDIKSIRSDNTEILRLIGRLEGKISNNP
jgi:hypothetical protein